MNIYQPYFYIIQNICTGVYYVGSKYGKGANPETFMTENGYQTSSKLVKNIILEFGLKIFILRKIRKFSTAEEAYKYETIFYEK